jgi:cell division protein FtsW
MAKKLAFDRILFTAVAVLVGFGLAMVYSASAVMGAQPGGHLDYLLLKQLAAAAVGLVAMAIAMHVDYRFWARRWVAWTLALGTLASLAVALLSPSLNNSRRWLFIGGISVQPSELAKVALVVFLAYQIAKRAARGEGSAATGLVLPTALIAGPMAALVLLGRDLAGALLIAAVATLMLFLAGMPWSQLTVGALSLSPLVASAIFWVPYRRQRLLAFLNPGADPLGWGFQASQSLIAVGSGGVFGLGLGKGLQKLYFLPYPHSDFVFAIVAEELGLVGALGVVALFGLYLWRGMRAGFRAPDEFGRYLAWGLTAVVVLQALFHISVALSLLPTTGMTLPFVSYGGTSMVVCLAASGVILNVSQHG